MSAFKILTGKPIIGEHRRRWEDHIRMDLKEKKVSIRGIWLIWLRIGIIGEPGISQGSPIIPILSRENNVKLIDL